MDKHSDIPPASAKIQSCIDRSRNEQQKSVLLCELAKSQWENVTRNAIDRSKHLLLDSSRIQKRSQDLRKNK